MADSNNITPLSKEKESTTEETWKFSTREVPISELDERETLLASLHCLKRMRYYGDQVEFYSFKIKTARNEKKADSFHYQKSRSLNLIKFFSDKLDKMGEQALNLGFVLPDTFEEIKALLPDDSKPEDKKKAEANNNKTIEEQTEYL